MATKLNLSCGVFDTSILKNKIELNENKGVCRKYWLRIDNTNYLFKANAGNTHYDSLTNVGEAFWSFICNKLNLPCVNAILAKDIDESNTECEGCLVENMLQEDEILVDFARLYKRFTPKGQSIDMTILGFEKILDILEKSGTYEFDKNEIISQLWNMYLMDYLFMQTDRHEGNIAIILTPKEDGYKLRLAPMFDNGMCLLLYRSNDNIQQYFKRYCGFNDEKDKRVFIHYLSSLYLQFSYDSVDEIFDYNEQIAKHILEDENFALLYKNFKELDLNKCFEEFEKISNYKIPDEYKILAINIFELRKYFIEKSFEKIANNNLKPTF